MTRKEKKEITLLFDRTIDNCYFYERNNETISLVNEIGVLRGLGYAMEALGLCPYNDLFLYYIDIQEKIKNQKENK